jgi:hypothetical protein
MTQEQMQALRKIEELVKQGKLSPTAAHARKNAIGAGMEAFREQFPEEASLIPSSKSVVNKLKMPAPSQKEETE